MSLDYVSKAVKFINVAVAADDKGDLEKAFENYSSALQWLELAIKYSPSVNTTKAYEEKLREYLGRAEEIKAFLDKKKKKKKSSGRRSKSSNGVSFGNNGFSGESDEDDDELRGSIMKSILGISPNVKWEDIAGLHSAKEALKEATIMPIECPQLFEEADVEPWTGILLYGPPGTGKSYLAKAVATASKTTFFMVSASDLLSKWQGESEKLVRELFAAAKKHSPSTIFIDEVDSLCRSRSDGNSGGGNSRDTIKTEFLVQMTAAAKCEEQILVLGATNLPWVLDEAFLRRFEKKIHIPLPDKNARMELFKIYAGKYIAPKYFKTLAGLTEGFSGADIAILVKTAKLIPIRKVREATHFIHKKEADVYIPCSSGTSGAIELTWLEIDGSKLKSPPLSMRDFKVAIPQCAPTVSGDSIERHKKWTEDFGMEGGL